MELPTSVTVWARAHHQLITRDRWIASGLGTRSFDRAIAQGILVRLAPNVALLPGAAIEPATRIAGWVLSIGRGTVASHRSAAFLWGADLVGDDPIDVIALRKTDRSTVAGVMVHNPRDARTLHAIARRSVSVTSPLRTLVDLGSVRPDLVPEALECFAVAGLVSPAAVARNAKRDRRQGRAGSATLVSAVDALTIDGKLRDSLLESRGAALFARYGIDGWIFHHPVGRFELDFAFPAEQLAIEVDGWATHGTRTGFEGDRERDAWLTSRGWVVLRFTWRQVSDRPGIVAARVAATLEHRRAAGKQSA